MRGTEALSIVYSFLRNWLTFAPGRRPSASAYIFDIVSIVVHFRHRVDWPSSRGCKTQDPFVPKALPSSCQPQTKVASEELAPPQVVLIAQVASKVPNSLARGALCPGWMCQRGHRCHSWEGPCDAIAAADLGCGWRNARWRC